LKYHLYDDALLSESALFKNYLAHDFEDGGNNKETAGAITTWSPLEAASKLNLVAELIAKRRKIQRLVDTEKREA